MNERIFRKTQSKIDSIKERFESKKTILLSVVAMLFIPVVLLAYGYSVKLSVLGFGWNAFVACLFSALIVALVVTVMSELNKKYEEI